MVYKHIYNLNICRLVRRSLGDEIKNLGVIGSPFCDKIKYISSGKLNECVNETLSNSGKEIQIVSNNTGKEEGFLETINENPSVCVGGGTHTTLYQQLLSCFSLGFNHPTNQHLVQ